MQAFSNENIKDKLCGGCDCSGFIPDLTYTYNSGAKTVTVTDASTYSAGDSRKVVHIEIRDKNGTKVKTSISAADGDDAVTQSVATLDESEGLDILATVVTENGCLSDGHATHIGAAGSLGSWDKDFDAITVAGESES